MVRRGVFDNHNCFDARMMGRTVPEPECFVKQLRFSLGRLGEEESKGRGVGDRLVESVFHIVGVGALYFKDAQASPAATDASEHIDMPGTLAKRELSSADRQWKLKRQTSEGIENWLMVRKRVLAVRWTALPHCLEKV